MDTPSLMIFVPALVTTAAVTFGLGYFVRKRFGERLIRTAEGKAREILTAARREAEETRRKSDKESKSAVTVAQRDFEDKIAQTRRDLENEAKVIKHKESTIEQKLDIVEKKEREAAYRLQEAGQKEKEALEKERTLDKMIAEEQAALARASALDTDQARRELIKRMEIDVRSDVGRMIQSIEREALAEADTKAKKILAQAMQRMASQSVIEQTTTLVQLPADDMKGRLIGKDGRNIKTFETLTGVDLIIDDTPSAVTLSAFDGVRREAARLALEELIKDGRIQPARIEEVVQKVKRNMENVLREEGEKALVETQLGSLHPEIVKLLGRLKFRTSYGQNVLGHSIETAFLMNAIAGQMKLDPILARRAGLLHDLGKAVSADVEGPHALIGGELARRYGEHPDVIHAIEAHHEDIPMQSVWPMLVQAADALSAARPGARRENLEQYLKRVTELEQIADKHPGVEKSYVIQGGHEVRVVVKPERVAEDAMPALAREITKKIGESLTFPGQIKVVVVRETRVEDVAK